MFQKHIIHRDGTVRDALKQLNELSVDAIIFVVDDNNKLLGSITDGDLRRGFINGLGFENELLDFIQPHPKFFYQDVYNIDEMEVLKAKNFKIIPILNRDHQIVDLHNFRTKSTIIPVEAIIMAGGEGKRLRPLTENTPKPLLKVGDKPIIEYNIDRLMSYGIKKVHISINYLGEQIQDYFGDGSQKEINIDYVKEDQPLGTVGSVLLCKNISFDDIIIMNSDILTNIDFLDFYKTHKELNADISVAATSYHVDVPYAVLEADDNNYVKSLKEKPKYTYYSNAGIYILKKKILDMIPQNQFYDITDLIEKALEMNHKVATYPINGYWLDIGKHEDFKKANEDIKHLKL